MFNEYSKVEKLFEKNDFSKPKFNINEYLKNMYSMNGFSHLKCNRYKRKIVSKYSNNVDYSLIEKLIESDTNRKYSISKILIEYNNHTKFPKISRSKLWASIKQLNYRFVILNTLNRSVISDVSIQNQKNVAYRCSKWWKS